MEDKEFLQRIGMELKLARVKAGISCAELSELVNLSSACIYKLERGKCNGHILNYKHIAETLCIDLVELLK